MGNRLFQTRTILERNEKIFGRVGTQWFEADPDGGEARGTIVQLDDEVWKEMGKPEEITVTIKPGDHLNHGEEDGN